MRSEIYTRRGGADEPQRAVSASARCAAPLVAAMLASSAPLPVLSQSVQLVVVDVHAVAEGIARAS